MPEAGARGLGAALDARRILVLPRRPLALLGATSLPPLLALRCALIKSRPPWCASITASPSAVKRQAITWRLVCASVFSTKPWSDRRFIIREIWLLIRQADDLRHFTVVQTRTTRDRRQRHLRTDRQPIIDRRSRTQPAPRQTIAITPPRRNPAARDAPAPSPPPRYPGTAARSSPSTDPTAPPTAPDGVPSRRAWITPNVAPTTPSATSPGSRAGACGFSRPRSTTPGQALQRTRALRASTRGPAASASTNTSRRTAGSRSSARNNDANAATNPRGPTQLRLPTPTHLQLQPIDRVVERRQKTIFPVAEALIERAVRHPRALRDAARRHTLIAPFADKRKRRAQQPAALEIGDIPAAAVEATPGMLGLPSQVRRPSSAQPPSKMECAPTESA